MVIVLNEKKIEINFKTFFLNFIFQCNPAGCLFELLLQLAIIMVGKQVLNNLLEIVLP